MMQEDNIKPTRGTAGKINRTGRIHNCTIVTITKQWKECQALKKDNLVKGFGHAYQELKHAYSYNVFSGYQPLGHRMENKEMQVIYVIICRVW